MKNVDVNELDMCGFSLKAMSRVPARDRQDCYSIH